MASKFTVEIGQVTEDEKTLILSDLNTTQIVETFSYSNSRLYLMLWAEGESEAKSALSRALTNVSADYLRMKNIGYPSLFPGSNVMI